VVEAMTLIQCIGVVACPFIFILTTTTKIRRFLYTVSLALIVKITDGKKRAKVSPVNSDD
jgi:hypothetical protein